MCYTTRFILLLLCLASLPAFGQLKNGSFETQDSIASLAYWTFTCNSGESSTNSPANGGSWSLRQRSGNTQGCFPGYVYQSLPQADSGQIWQLEGWARIDSTQQPFSNIGIYLAAINSLGDIRLLQGDTTQSTEWTQLSLTDTLDLQADDTLAVLLDPGLTGGPALGLAYFDQLSLDSLGLTDLFRKKELDWISIRPIPHPISDEGWLHLSLDRSSWLNLSLYSLSGQRLSSLAQGRFQEGTHVFKLDVSDLASGLYLLFLHTPEGIVRERLMVR